MRNLECQIISVGKVFFSNAGGTLSVGDMGSPTNPVRKAYAACESCGGPYHIEGKKSLWELFLDEAGKSW